MTIGWYVHHHGAGHLTRLRAVLPHLGDVVALSSLADPGLAELPWIGLPPDVTDDPQDPTAGGTLHWAPLGHAGLRDRMAAIAAWIERARPDVVVVDVSVEVALLARLLGVPVVLVAQRGVRRDPAHALAYAQASAIAAPWTCATHLEGDVPANDRLEFVGAISRFDGRLGAVPSGSGDVLLLTGAGGHALRPDDVRAAAGSTPGRTWHVAGALRAGGAGIVDHGPEAPVEQLLTHCSVVVGSAGGNVVAEVAAARRPFVCLPQQRPFGEQERQGEALRRIGAAEVCARWPAPQEWGPLLARAEARPVDRWAALHDGGGARRLAAVIRRVGEGR